MISMAAGVLTGKAALAGHSLAFFQQDMINSGNSKLLELFVGVAAIALLAQAVAVVGVAFGLWKAQKLALTEIAELKSKILPFVEKSHTLVEELSPQVKEITAKTNVLISDLTPHVKDITSKVQTLVTELSPQITGITTKVHAITGNVEEISTIAKDHVVSFGPTIDAANETVKQTNQTVRATLMDANQKTRAQVERVNELVTGAIDSAVKIGKAIEYGVTQPAREVSGFVHGAKTTFEHLAKRYGGSFSVSGLADLVGFGKKKAAPSPYTPPPVRRPVEHQAPEAMGTRETRLPAAFGSTKRDLDL